MIRISDRQAPRDGTVGKTSMVAAGSYADGMLGFNLLYIGDCSVSKLTDG
jgi:hypothetical protein